MLKRFTKVECPNPLTVDRARLLSDREVADILLCTARTVPVASLPPLVFPRMSSPDVDEAFERMFESNKGLWLEAMWLKNCLDLVPELRAKRFRTAIIKKDELTVLMLTNPGGESDLPRDEKNCLVLEMRDIRALVMHATDKIVERREFWAYAWKVLQTWFIWFIIGALVALRCTHEPEPRARD